MTFRAARSCVEIVRGIGCSRQLSWNFGIGGGVNSYMTLNDASIRTCVVAFTASVFVAFAVACVAQTPQQSRSSRSQNHVTEEQNIREAVFRYLFIHNASGHQDKPHYYCLSVAGGDPTDELMRRFKSHNPPVRKASQCNSDPYKGVFDKSTGKRALMFEADSVKWTSEMSVEVEGGYYEDGLSASGNTYRVVKRNGAWKVTQEKMKWLS